MCGVVKRKLAGRRTFTLKQLSRRIKECWIFEIISMYILTVEARLNCVPLFPLCSLWLPDVEIALHLVISLTLSFPLHFRKIRETFSSFLKLTVGSDLPIFTMKNRTCSTSQSTTILSRVQFRSRALYLQNWHFFCYQINTYILWKQTLCLFTFINK